MDVNKTKQEVLEAVQGLNRAWTTGNVDALKGYFHRDMVAITPTEDKRLEGKEACIDAWEAFVKAAKIRYWKEFDHKIQLYENTAVVTYYFDMSFDMGGQNITMGGRDMFVMVKEHGQWLAVADQFSPYPRHTA